MNINVFLVCVLLVLAAALVTTQQNKLKGGNKITCFPGFGKNSKGWIVARGGQTVGATPNCRKLVIQGTNAADGITLQCDAANQVQVWSNIGNVLAQNVEQVIVSGKKGNDWVVSKGACVGAQWPEMKLLGGSGNDLLHCGHNTCTAFGGNGVDTIIGGDGDDILKLQNGGGWADGKAGDDRVYGTSRLEILIGGLGNDSVYGGRENDLMVAGVSNLGRVRHNTTWKA